jgi:hypothetical protein
MVVPTYLRFVVGFDFRFADSRAEGGSLYGDLLCDLNSLAIFRAAAGGIPNGLYIGFLGGLAMMSVSACLVARHDIPRRQFSPQCCNMCVGSPIGRHLFVGLQLKRELVRWPLCEIGHAISPSTLDSRIRRLPCGLSVIVTLRKRPTLSARQTVACETR